jgi:serine/threonine protein kinase
LRFRAIELRDVMPEPNEKASWELQEGEWITPGRLALRRLGGGSLYETYLAWDDRLMAVVVAKLIRPDQVEDPRALRNLRREAEALDLLDHPVIVRGFGAVLDGPKPHIVLEHLEGPNLRSLVKRYGPLSLQELLPLALHICSALHYMTTEKMVHLDVKPANIVMGAPPRLIDLSIARSIADARRIRSPAGTDAYMAPEQCQPGVTGDVGPPADVWGLGASLFEAISGTLPFSRGSRKAEAPAGRFPQLIEEPAPFDKVVPPPVADLVLGCLARDPAERPTASELATGLEPLVGMLPRRPVIGRLRPRFFDRKR